MIRRAEKELKVKKETVKLDRNERKSQRLDSRPFAEMSDLKLKMRSKKKKRINRLVF